MTQQTSSLTQRAAELRLAFDRSFSEAPTYTSAQTEAFLGIAASGAPYALRLAEIAGLHADKKITVLPSDSNDLLGVTSFRGALIPVYDLRQLLGYSTGVNSTPRWLVLVASKIPVALAFEQFDGYHAVTTDFITQQTSDTHIRSHISDAVRIADVLRPIVNLVSILETIKQRAHAGASQRGQ